MRLAEKSRHVWNIENIGFWTYTSPIQGPEFQIEGVEDNVFSYSLEVKEKEGENTKQVVLVFKGAATPTSPGWMPLRVSASVLTPEREVVSLTTKDVDPFNRSSTTLLELLSLDGEDLKWLERDDLTIVIRTAERLVSIPRQVTKEDRIPSVKIIAILGEDRNGTGLCRVRSDGGTDEDKRILRFLKKSRCPTVVRFRLTLMNPKGRIHKISKSNSYLFPKWHPEEMPGFLLSFFFEEDKHLDLENLRMVIDHSCRVPSFHSASRGNSHVIHSYRNHLVFLDSVTPDDDRDILSKLKRDKWTDLSLLTEDGMSFSVHRCVLAARSRYFEALLTTNMAEKDKEEIYLRGVHSSVLGHLLDFLYTANIPEDLSVETTVELYTLANYLEMLELCGFCLHHITNNLRLSNVMSVVPLLQLHWDPDLDKEVNRLITSNAEEGFQSQT